MVETVIDRTLFHVTRELPYNPHPALVAGSTILCGTVPNPFFGHYETPRTFPVTLTNGQVIAVRAIKWLQAVREGSITPLNLPQTAYEIAEHFQMLSRELIMELTRRDVSPTAPSRQSCLWTVETMAEARLWKTRLGGAGSVVELKASGTVHRADSALLEGDAESFSSTVEKASRYWKGDKSEAPEMEVLFSGTATAVRVLTDYPAPPFAG